MCVTVSARENTEDIFLLIFETLFYWLELIEICVSVRSNLYFGLNATELLYVCVCEKWRGMIIYSRIHMGGGAVLCSYHLETCQI